MPAQAAATGLIAFGAVYFSRVHPNPAQCKISLTAEDRIRLAQLHQHGLQRHGPDVRAHDKSQHVSLGLLAATIVHFKH